MARSPKNRGPAEPLFLVIDKPEGRTSHDIVALMRAVTGVKRCGHTGTLDPFATGVLPLALGAATRFISFLDESTKVYEAELLLGAATRTGDPEGEVCEEAPVPSLDWEGVQQVMRDLTGPQLQVPPAYSARKVDGKPLYQYAREGQEIEVPPRPIDVRSWQLLALESDRVRFRVECSRGTYVRTLGEDLARALGTVGHLVALRRLRSGCFSVEAAITLDELADIVTGCASALVAFPLARDQSRPERRTRDEVRVGLRARCMELAAAFRHLPTLALAADEVGSLTRSGQLPPLEDRLPAGHEGAVLLVDDAGEAVALAEVGPGLSRALRVVSAAARQGRWLPGPGGAPASDGQSAS